MPICGPKLSLCTLIVSIWAVIQLPIMGVLYYIRSVALLEDLPIKPHYINPHTFFKEADEAFELVAYNCWIATCVYLVVLVFSGQQFFANRRASAKA